MSTPNTISSLGDVDKISELENSTLTPTEIKKGIESGKALGEKLAGLDATGGAAIVYARGNHSGDWVIVKDDSAI